MPISKPSRLWFRRFIHSLIFLGKGLKMEVEIKPSANYPHCFDLYVNGELIMETESYAVVSEIKYQIENRKSEFSEMSEVAENIYNP